MKSKNMRRIAFTVSFIFCLSILSGQVEQLVYLKNGSLNQYVYIQETESHIVYEPLKKGRSDGQIKIAKDNILRIQTLGINYLADNYSKILSDVRVTDYSLLAGVPEYDFEISCREINDTIVLLTRLTYLESSKNWAEQIILFDKEKLSIELKSGVIIELNICDPIIYKTRNHVSGMLYSTKAHNLAFVILNDHEIEQLKDSKISKIYLGNKKIKATDEYALMRQLLALSDVKWSKAN